MGSKLEIDEKQVEALASRFWNKKEIAAFFDCSESSISHKFANIVQKGREQGKGRLRDAQLKAALKGNPTMLIWLGKQYLKQTEKIEVTNDELINETLEFTGVPKSGNGNGRFKRFYN